jgi:hypothetical protein
MDKKTGLTEVDFEQAEMLDRLIGSKIYNIEILEEDNQAMIKIILDGNDDKFILIHAEGMNMFVVEPKPKNLH